MKKEKKEVKLNLYAEAKIRDVIAEMAAYAGTNKSEVIRQAVLQKWTDHLSITTQ